MWDVVGHESVVAALARSVEQGAVAHAYLFLGPEGVGKRFLALKLAQALNCTAQQKPCGACPQCRRILGGKHADVQTIGVPKDEESRGRKVISIEQVLEMQRLAGLQPFEGAYRVFILDGAEHLSLEAANCLLKTLEEPPAAVCIVLLATEAGPILPTILSRCRTYELRPVSTQKIVEALVSRHQVQPEQAKLLARLAEGRIGWAVRAAGDPTVLEARSETLDQVLETLRLPLHERLAQAGRLAEAFGRSRDSVFAWLDLLQSCWRDLLLSKAGQSEALVNVDRADALQAMVTTVTLQQAAAAIRHAQAAREHLERNVNPRLALDVLMLYLPEVAPAATL